MAGKYLGDSAGIEEKIQGASRDVLAAVHFVLFGNYANANFVRRNIRKFSKFSFDSDDRESHLRLISESLSLKQLKSVAVFFNSDCEGVSDALEISRTIVGCVEIATQDLKKTPSSKSSVKSEVKTRPSSQLQTELCQLQDECLKRETEVLAIQCEIIELNSDSDNAQNAYKIATKEALVQVKKNMLELVKARIANKETLIQQTIDDSVGELWSEAECDDALCDDVVRDEPPREETIATVSSDSVRATTVDERVLALTKTMNNFLSRQTVGTNIITFDGSSSLKWPIFLAQYETASELCGFSDREKVMRLDQCLRGEARQCVELLLCTAREPDTIIKILKTKYGQPDAILREIVSTISGLSRVVSSETFMSFCYAVQNMEAIVNENTFNFVDQRNLISRFLSKLPPHLLTHWGSYLVSKNIPLREEKLKDLAAWAQNMVEITSRTFSHFDSAQPIANEAKPSPSSRAPQQQKICKACKTTEHGLDRCPVFKSADTKRRWKIAENCRACYCCLNYHHGSCNNRKPCAVNGCEKYHNPLLHKKENLKSDVQVTTCTTDVNCDVMLKIVPVKIRGPLGCLDVKAILDEGSTTTLLDSSVAVAIGLTGPITPLCCKWTGDIHRFDNESQIVQAEIAAASNSTKYYALKDVRTVKDLNLPNQNRDIRKLTEDYPFVSQVTTAIYDNEKPLILIGQNNAKLIVSRQIVQPTTGTPIISKTLLGWTIHGPIVSSCMNIPKSEIAFTCCEDRDEELHEAIKAYFRLENFGVKYVPEGKRKTVEEERALRIAEETIRQSESRYEIGIPWKSDDFSFPDTKPMALQRLKCLENRLRSNKQTSAAYCKEIEKLIVKGYALPVEEYELKDAQHVWYLPHFAVKNPNKPEKVRVVFDAAAKSNSMSLNDFILPGPDWLTPLFDVLCKFRTHRIAFTGDIEEMFNRIEIVDKDSFAQCFLWRDLKSDKPVRIYRMKAMLFGTTSSPFLAQFVKNYNAKKYSLSHKEAALAIINDHYVDDYLHGADNDEDAIRIIKDVIYVHAKAGFKLRKIATNSEIVRRNLPTCLLSKTSVSSMDRDAENQNRVLGMLWNAATDNFGFSLDFKKIDANIMNGSKTPTKRQVLRVAMSIFDPLGLLSPISIKVKMLLQDIWRSGIGWDDFISSSMKLKWESWLKSINDVQHLEVPRFVPMKLDKIELHIFNDASENAYASSVYIRTKTGIQIDVTLIAAKARVAPLKTITIPKMELLAALMGARLCTQVIKSLKLQKVNKYLWTDSRTVLHWIKSDKKLQTFVASRVGEILELTEINEWFWIPSEQNIADICTRDNFVKNLENNHAWFKGPKFLYNTENSCTETQQPLDSNIEERFEISLNAITSTDLQLPIIKSHYTWVKLLRITARIKRFIGNLKSNAVNRKTGPMTADELLWSEQLWWKHVQQTSFPDDIKNIKTMKRNKNGKLRKLSLIMDNNDILRISSRIHKAENVLIEKEPIVLCGSSPYVRLMILHYHKFYGHQGLETVINELRRRYWIPRIRSVTKKVFFDCAYCKKRTCKPIQPKMGALPKERLQHHDKPFTATGIDYFGPFLAKSGRKIEKRYGVLFTCLTTRAIHIEIAHSLSTDSCIMAIRRFLSRRGSVKIFLTDNATNFRGASRELIEAYEELDEKTLQEEMANRRIQWKFIPPLSPHMGGAWERLVGCFKRSLMAILTDRHPTDEVLLTLFAEAEYIVNSRPLTHVSGDATDDYSISPNDILIGKSIYVRAPGVFTEKDLLLSKQWRVSQALVDLFWKRWMREYLPTLIGRTKWTSDEPNIKEGEIIIMNDAKLPRGEWPLGVVIKTYPGEDKAIRVADVKTATGIYRRPVSKLHRLNVCVDQDQDVNTGGGMSLRPDEML